MANRNFPSSRLYTFHTMPVQVDCSIAIGSTGAVSSVTGPGVAGVTRLGVGTYRIQLQDNYNALFHVFARIQSPVAGSSVASGSLVTNTIYQITAVGTTNWQTAGLPTGITAAVGQVFKAAGTATGTGTAKALGVSGISSVEIIGSGELAPSPSVALSGGYITIQCLAATDATTTTLIPTDPASGSTLLIAALLSNSSVQ